jgi:hypothetical protein
VPVVALPLPLQAAWKSTPASSTPASTPCGSSLEILYDDCPVLVI